MGARAGRSVQPVFSDRANAVQSDINELFRIGRRSLAIGISILVLCLLLAHFGVRALFEEPFRRLLEESLLILGWVANCRPLEIFLYDWWPLVRRRDLYQRLARAVVESRPESGEHAQVKFGDEPATGR